MTDTKVTKADIVERIYKKLHNINKQDIHSVLDTFFEEVKTSLKDEHSIELRGFGTFEVRKRKGRAKARNPKTGETVTVDKHSVAAFRPGKELKEMVW